MFTSLLKDVIQDADETHGMRPGGVLKQELLSPWTEVDHFPGT